jgi:sugar (pentulose or hexulose) kinase
MAGLRTGMALERVATALGAVTRDERARLAAAAVLVLDDPEALAAARAAVRVGMTLDDGSGVEGVRLTLRREARPDQVWAAAVDQLVAGAMPSIDRIRAAVGDHATVLAAGGWLRNAAVLRVKRHQFPGLTVTAVAEAGAAGAAYLAGVAAGVFPEVTTLHGAPWDAAASPPSTAPSPAPTSIPESIAPVREVL